MPKRSSSSELFWGFFQCLFSPSVPRGPSQLSVCRTRWQQLSVPKSLWQLPPLLLLTHRRVGRAQGRLPEKKTVSSNLCVCVCLSYSVTSPLSALHPSCLCLHSYVLLELVETERDYVRDLGSVVEVRRTHFLFLIRHAGVNPSFSVFQKIFRVFLPGLHVQDERRGGSWRHEGKR